jgi:hypothetical protein
VKEAKAILQAVNEMTSPPDTTLTIQQIIESSVERGLREEGEGSNSGGKPLDLSPSKACVDMTKSCLDMPHSKMNSITAWLQQVETARSPIKPDISILRKPIESQPETQEPTSQQQPFLTIVSPIIPRPEDASLTIKLLEPKGIVWPTEPLPQQFAVKSRPTNLTPSTGLQPSWRRPERTDNPLLNQRPDMLSQVSLEVAPPTPSPTIPSQTGGNYKQDVQATSYKRARTETDFSSSFPTDLTKPHPLDLSNDYRGERSERRDHSSPFDYSINRSELISGQLNRLKNLDNRSGI